MSHSLKHFTWLLPPTPSHPHQRPDRLWVQPEVRQVPGAVPVAISWKIQKFTCLDLLVQSSRRGRNWQGEVMKSKPDLGLMTRWQEGARAGREGRICHKLWRNHTQHHLLPKWQGCRQPSLELFSSGNITLGNLNQSCFHPHSPYARNIPAGGCPLPAPSAWESSELADLARANFLWRLVPVWALCCQVLSQSHWTRQICTCSSLLNISSAGLVEQRPKGSAVAAPCGACSRAGSPNHCCSSCSCHWQTGPRGKEIAQVFGKPGPNKKTQMINKTQTFLDTWGWCVDLRCSWPLGAVLFGGQLFFFGGSLRENSLGNPAPAGWHLANRAISAAMGWVELWRASPFPSITKHPCCTPFYQFTKLRSGIL